MMKRAFLALGPGRLPSKLSRRKVSLGLVTTHSKCHASDEKFHQAGTGILPDGPRLVPANRYVESLRNADLHVSDVSVRGVLPRL